MHLDSSANERVYGRPVAPSAIFDGKLRPPHAFRPLTDVLIACEENRYERPASYDGDSDSSGSGLRAHHSNPGMSHVRTRPCRRNLHPVCSARSHCFEHPREETVAMACRLAVSPYLHVVPTLRDLTGITVHNPATLL